MKDFDYRGVPWQVHPALFLEKCIRLLEADPDIETDTPVCKGLDAGTLLAALLVARKIIGGMVEPSNIFDDGDE